MMKIALFLCAILTLGRCMINEEVNKKILVLIENLAIRETHSIYFKFLKDRGYELSFKFADDSSLDLMKFGEYIYKHVLIFAPSVREFGGRVDVKSFVKYIDAGGNILVTGNSDIGEAIRELGSECGVEFDDEKTSVIDHHNYDVRDEGKHTLLVVSSKNVLPVSVITGSKQSKPILYRGIGISADTENPLLISILHGGSTSYSYNPDKPMIDYPNGVGVNTQLITGLQARNNARMVFVGSVEFFSDDFFGSSVENAVTGKIDEATGNRELAESISKWWLGEQGVLRVVDVKHHRVGETKSPRDYTISEKVIYSIAIETMSDDGKWVPYKANDIQLEVVRIDPFIRTNMPQKGGRYTVEFKLPDVYGVFKFLVDYHRLGYTHITSISQVSVRPFTHRQYERFLVAAYPYYASSISMLVGVLLFSFVFLYFRDEKDKVE